MDGIGCFVSKGRVWTDLDKCVKDGVLEPWVRVIIAGLNTYSEISPSGDGLHCFGLGELPPGTRRKIKGCEMYGDGRFTVTGRHIPETPTELRTSQHLLEINRALVSNTLRPYQLNGANQSVSKDPDVFIKSKTLEELEAGQSPNDDESDGDYQFCALLTEQGLTDAQIDARFRDSKRMRPKWDERRPAGTYGSMTIAAVRRNQAAMKSGRMPGLVSPENQDSFLDSPLKMEPRPDIVTFDTLTACFKYDTNDPKDILHVNDFLIQLRSHGLAVLFNRHEGKNGTQRGRTDIEDNCDLVIHLPKRRGWTPGDGLEFSVTYEKVRWGDKLRPFDAQYDDLYGWQVVENELDQEIIALLQEVRALTRLPEPWTVATTRLPELRGEPRRMESISPKHGQDVGGRCDSYPPRHPIIRSSIYISTG
jgi:hypothetical protein